MSTSTPSPTKPAPAPERTGLRQATIRKLTKRAIKAAGIDIPSIALVDEVTKLVTLRCEETRARLSSMVQRCIGHGITDDHLDRLAWVLETHWVDENGEEQIDLEAAP